MKKTREHIQLQEELCHKLEAIEKALDGQQEVCTEKFIQIIEVIVMSEKYQLTPSEIEKMKRQSELLGQDKIKELGDEWLQVIAKVRAEMEKGTSPNDPEVRKLFMRVREIAGMFTAGDYEILQKMKNNYLMNPDKLDQRGLDPTIIEYMSKAGPQL